MPRLPLLLLPLLVLPLAVPARAQTPSWEAGPATLKPGPGEAMVAANCGACHSLDVIIMNTPFLTAAQWRAEISRMQKAFGAPIDAATAQVIEAYLAATYATP